MDRKIAPIIELINVLDILREKCPWDRKQTIESLKMLTLEECYELTEAIDNKDFENIKEELGDVLLHILFYSKIAEEMGLFNIGDVAETERKKLIFRHPHVFSTTSVKDSEEVIKNWDELKKQEKGSSRENTLSGIPQTMPSMMKAIKIQKKVSKVGFDWSNREDVWAKVIEEIDETRDAIHNKEQKDVEEEFGDLLFAVTNAARLYGVDAEEALERCNKKFTNRFNFVEKSLKERNIDIKDASIDEMERFWQKAKEIKI